MTAQGRVAQIYYRQAQGLFAAGKGEQAARLLDVALEFDPNHSESLYLYARIELARQEDTLDGVRLLRQAIESARWEETDPRLPQLDLAEVLVRTRRYREAMQALRRLGAGPGSGWLGGTAEPRLAVLWARSLRGLGERAEVERFLREAVRVFPKHAGLHELAARVQLDMGRPDRALRAAEDGLAILPDSTALLLTAAELSRGERRSSLLERYFRLGGSEPLAAALAMEAESPEEAALVERFFASGGNGRVLILDRVRSLLEARESAREKQAGAGAGASRAWSTFLSRTGGYSGQRVVDSDRDGFYEERYRYVDGSLRQWLLDRDQDGVPEARVELERESPRVVTAGGWTYRYGQYPYLEEAVLADGGGRREYLLLPMSFRLPVLQEAPGGRAGLRLKLAVDAWPAEGRIRAGSYQMDEYPGGSSTSRRRYLFQEGRVVRMEEGAGPGGRFAHVVVYRDGLPVFGTRDLDGDGEYEMREEYSGGALNRLTLDQDRDGRPEFVQVLSPRQEMLWDYDGDGVPDSRELVDAAGRRVREFSSRLNGTFDLQAVFASGGLVRFERSGRRLPIVYDGASDLYWLGKRGAAGLERDKLAEGVQTIDGRRYFVLHYDGKVYIEEL